MRPDGAQARSQAPIDLGRGCEGYGKRFVVRANEILTAFLELESSRFTRKIYHSLESPLCSCVSLTLRAAL